MTVRTSQLGFGSQVLTAGGWDVIAFTVPSNHRALIKDWSIFNGGLVNDQFSISVQRGAERQYFQVTTLAPGGITQPAVQRFLVADVGDLIRVRALGGQAGRWLIAGALLQLT